MLTQEGQKHVEACIADAERRSSLEVVVATMSKSDSYAVWRLLATTFTTMFVALGAHLWLPELSASWLLTLQLPLGVLLWLLFGVPPILRALAPDAVEVEAVRREAELLFLEHAIFETRERSGVLIAVSELERRVEILADKGLTAEIPQEDWRRYADTIATAARNRRTAEGLINIIESLAKRAHPILGAPSDPINELSDTVVRVDN